MNNSGLKIYCDGACSGNPGAGAWAYVVFDSSDNIVFSGSGTALFTTNNQMELMAVIKALAVFDECEIILDSKYVKDGITSWIHKWKVNGWKTTTGLVKNLHLWQLLDTLVSTKNIRWSWQKGHAYSFHDYADELARISVIK